MTWLVSVSVKVSVAPGMIAPVGSVTVPWMEVRNCANAGVLRQNIAAVAQIARTLEILFFINRLQKKRRGLLGSRGSLSHRRQSFAQWGILTLLQKGCQGTPDQFL